jgi:integrase
LPPVKLPYLKCYERRGKLYFYYRRGKHPIRIKGDLSHPGFLEEYERIHASFESTSASQEGHAAGTIAAVITEYKESQDYKSLSVSSRRNYLMYLDRIQEEFGRFSILALTRRVALKKRNKLAHQPSVANHYMAVLRKLFSFALDMGYVEFNPVLKPKKMKTGTYEPWPDEELEKFRKAAPAHMVLALMLGLYTGQRRGDLVCLTWNQIKDGGLELVQQKTGARLWIPMHRALQATVAIQTKKAVTILTDENGLPWDANEFSKAFRLACNAAGVPDKYVFHGLRKNATRALLEAGCTKDQAKAITGHTTDEMVNHYAKQIDQKKMAKAAIRKLERQKKSV